MLLGRKHTNEGKHKMNKIMIIAAIAAASLFTGCQTRITAEKFPEQVLPIQKVVKVNGEDKVIVENYQIASGGWYATAREPLYSDRALEGLEIGVSTNGMVFMKLGNYRSNLSTNAVAMVDGMFKNGANLALAIGEAYTKIAGGGAQAATVMDVAAKCINFFADKGGDVTKAKVVADEAAKKLTISDGTTCVECNEAGVCTECQLPAAQTAAQ